MYLNISELKILLLKSNNAFLRDLTTEVYDFVIENIRLGFVRNDMVDIVSQYTEVFTIDKDSKTVSLESNLKTPKQITEAINDILLKIKDKNILHTLSKWRNEKHSVYSGFRSKLWFEIERAATGILGVIRYAVHVTGYTIIGGEYRIWIAKRSMSKETSPGLLDNMVGGGCNSKYSIHENVINECKEEAGIPDNLFQNLKSCGCISFMHEDDRGILPEIIFCFDLLLPTDFTPKNTDGEVENFSLLSIDEVGQLIGKPCFKFNSALVTLDFYFRNGLINPDECPEYFGLYQKLHTKIPLD